MKHITRFIALFCVLTCLLPRVAHAAVPAAPTNFAATAGNMKVTLSWSAVTGATSYVVFRRVGSATTYSIIAQPNTNALVDAVNMTGGTTYFYIVRARNAEGDSPNSAQINCTPAPSLPPANPTATVGDGQITLSWTYSPGAASYRIYDAASATATPVKVGETTGMASTTFVHSGLTNGSSHFYVVRSVNVGVESANSTQVSGTLPTLAPPTNLVATPGESRVALSWSGVTGAKSYSVERRQSGTAVSTMKSVAIVSAPQTSYTDTGADSPGPGAPLVNGQGYVYQIRAQNAGGFSVPSLTKGAIPRERQKVNVLVRSVSPSASDFAGKDTYNDDGAAQVAAQTVPGGTSAIYGVKVQCEGSESATFVITGPASRDGWSVSYFDAQNKDITGQVASPQGWPVPVLTLGQTYEIGVKVTPGKAASSITPLTLLVRAASSSQAEKRDTVQIITTRQEPNPDLLIRNEDETDEWSGDDIYNPTDTSQSRAQMTVPGTAAVYRLQVQNEDGATRSYIVKGPGSADGWQTKYVDVLSGADVTLQATGSSGYPLTNLVGGASRELRVEVTPDETAAATSSKEVGVTVSSSTNAAQKDEVKTSTTLQKIGAMQINFGAGWEPLSKYTGPTGIPMPDVVQYSVIGFQVTPANEGKPWPDTPQFKPTWKITRQKSAGDTGPDKIEEHTGDTIWVHFPQATPNILAGDVVQAECGNAIAATINVKAEE